MKKHIPPTLLRRTLLVMALSALWFGLTLTHATADPIPGLYNTGVDNNGVVLSGGSIDPHYTISGSNTFVTLTDWPIGYFWMSNSSTSKWISPHANQNSYYGGAASEPAGTYAYRITFDLTGFVPATASIAGFWAVDNSGSDILINGLSTGNSIIGELGAGTFSAFAVTNGFVNGINTLDFLVYNAPSGAANPSGLRVEMSGTAAVPEPTGYMLVGLGVAILMVCRRRR